MSTSTTYMFLHVLLYLAQTSFTILKILFDNSNKNIEEDGHSHTQPIASNELSPVKTHRDLLVVLHQLQQSREVFVALCTSACFFLAVWVLKGKPFTGVVGYPVAHHRPVVAEGQGVGGVLVPTLPYEEVAVALQSVLAQCVFDVVRRNGGMT